MLSHIRQHSAPFHFRAGFTLVEILAVMGLMVTLMLLVSPAVTPLQRAGDITKAAYDVAGALENARAYAAANNTYVWVGFYEEDAMKGNGTSGKGRVILSTVASKDGSMIYNADEIKTSGAAINPGSLFQVQKLIRIDNVHLKTASASDTHFPMGLGTGDTFKTRPAVSEDGAQIGDVTPVDSTTPIQYPVGSDTTKAKYVFAKVIQFSPRGEARINNTNTSILPVLEIGLQQARGNVVDEANPNVVAIQVTGLLGNVKIYRQ